MPKDYYTVLGISRGADSGAIHSAFRALARRYHPDAGTGSSSGKFREALEAYQTLSDPERRRQHDIDLGKAVRPQKVEAEPLFGPPRAREAGFAPAAPSGLNDLLSEALDLMDAEFGFTEPPPRFFF
jgi:curved DNA-binding protein CbpA